MIRPQPCQLAVFQTTIRRHIIMIRLYIRLFESTMDDSNMHK